MNVSAIRRRMGGLLAALALAAGIVGVAAPSAHAAQVDVACLGTQASHFSPGLTFTPRPTTVTASGVLAPCTSSDPAVISGTSTTTVSGSLSCTAGTATGTRTITWNTGETSTLFVISLINLRPGGQVVVESHGTVTAGKFLGDTADSVFVLTTTQLLGCLTPDGVTDVSGPMTLTLIHP